MVKESSTNINKIPGVITKPDYSKLRNLPSIYNIKLKPYKKELGQYELTWDYVNIPNPYQKRPYLFLFKNGMYFCVIDSALYLIPKSTVLGFTSLIDKGLTLCLDGKIPPKEGTHAYQFVFDFSRYSGMKNFQFFSEKMDLPLYPELNIEGVKQARRRGRRIPLIIIDVFNAGSATSAPFCLDITGKDYDNRTFHKRICTQSGWKAGQFKSVAFRPQNAPPDFLWQSYCITVSLEKKGALTNGYNPNTPQETTKCFRPPHVRSH